MPEGRLHDKVAIVTGGGSGIGKAIALRFAAEGARVAVLDLREEAAVATAREAGEAGGRATAYPCDVTRQAEVFAVFARVAAEIGPLDLLVNNAGVAHVGTVERVEEEDLDRVYSVNVKGVYNCLRAGVEAMRGRGGAIVNMGSVASSIGIPDRFAYSMSKGAVLAMTYSVACDYVREGIRCNSIAPARVHTPFVDGFLARDYPGREAEMFEKLSKTQPIGRMGRPDEVASLAVYLCSDEAAFVTGTNYPLDGGFLTLKI